MPSPTAPLTETDAFKRWFGDSQVVDAHGKPLVVYHGFKSVDMRIENGEVVFLPGFRIFRSYWATEAGIWFSPSKSIAAAYGTPVPFYLKSLNVMRHESPMSLPPIGRDGVYRMRGKGDCLADAWEIAVFSPFQIKLAVSNDGEFDSTNADIYA